jgi:hypothetical protein
MDNDFKLNLRKPATLILRSGFYEAQSSKNPVQRFQISRLTVMIRNHLL